MVNRQEQDSGRRPAIQGFRDVIPEPNIGSAATPYHFAAKNLPAHGGLFPFAAMLDVDSEGRRSAFRTDADRFYG